MRCRSSAGGRRPGRHHLAAVQGLEKASRTCHAPYRGRCRRRRRRRRRATPRTRASALRGEQVAKFFDAEPPVGSLATRTRNMPCRSPPPSLDDQLLAGPFRAGQRSRLEGACCLSAAKQFFDDFPMVAMVGKPIESVAGGDQIRLPPQDRRQPVDAQSGSRPVRPPVASRWWEMAPSIASGGGSSSRWRNRGEGGPNSARRATGSTYVGPSAWQAAERWPFLGCIILQICEQAATTRRRGRPQCNKVARCARHRRARTCE